MYDAAAQRFQLPADTVTQSVIGRGVGWQAALPERSGGHALEYAAAGAAHGARHNERL